MGLKKKKEDEWFKKMKECVWERDVFDVSEWNVRMEGMSKRGVKLEK